MRSFACILLLIFSAILPLSAQGPAAPPAPPRDENAVRTKALGDLLQVMKDADAKIAEQRASITEKSTEEEKKEINDAIEASKAKLVDLGKRFTELATGLPSDALDSAVPNTDITEELRALLEPVISELRDATARPRELEQMRKEIAVITRRLGQARSALERVNASIPSAQGELVQRLVNLRDDWQATVSEDESRLSALKLQLKDREDEDDTLVQSLSRSMAGFFRSRGWNFLRALLIFGALIFIVRRVYHWGRRWSPLHKGRPTFSTRLLDLIVAVGAVVLGAVGSLVSLYVAGDWVLLPLAAFLILGFIWAMKSALPGAYEHIKLMLNFGAVREGERLVYEGIPWRVKRVNVYTDLVNPRLAGGVMRLPLSKLSELHSRIVDEDEPWFPTEKGDWVLLSGTTLGRVIIQTPEFVQIVLLGGSVVSYPTAGFLALAPRNLSCNFRITARFGIDYAHQAISTTEVPRIFEERIERELIRIAGKDNVISLKVEFAQAGASSLDYDINADFDGEVAARYNRLARAIHAICVDVCNEHGWVIPFTQVTLHQAAAAALPPATEP